MNGLSAKRLPKHNLAEYRIQASILLKTLRADDHEPALTAALRFQALAHLNHLSGSEILLQKSKIKLKHALTVIAQEHNYTCWADFKHYLERREALKRNRGFTALYPRRCWGYLNEWYASYAVARDHLAQVDGYLLPYKDQFFICTRGYIQTLGIDPDDPDWQLIGRDWVKPDDAQAWQRLNDKLAKIAIDAGAI